MKRFIIFLYFITQLLLVSAQNWQPMKSGEIRNYFIDSTNTFTSLWVDSNSVINTDSIFYLNRILKKVNMDMPSNSFVGIYVENRTPFYFSKIHYKSNGDAVLQNDSGLSYLIKTNAAIGQSWIFDSVNNIQAHVVQKIQSLVLGQVDSLKTIILDGNDTLILSKNYGLIQFPTGDTLTTKTKLVGLEGPNTALYIPKYLDFFDFEVGDIFYYKYYSGGRWATVSIYKKLVVKNKTIVGDSITYQIDYFEQKIVEETYGIETDTTYVTVLDSLYIYHNVSSIFLDKYDGQMLNDPKSGMKYKRINVQWNTKFNTLAKSYSAYPFCKGYYPSDTVFECSNPMICSNIYSFLSYGKNIGLIFRSYSEYTGTPYENGGYNETLIGYIKNGIVYGDTLTIPNFIKEEPIILNSNFNVFPNPIIDFFNIEIPVISPSTNLIISDISGRIIYSQQIFDSRTQFDMSNCNSGLYFFKLIDDQGVEIKRIIKL